jgi:hypothetical protein
MTTTLKVLLGILIIIGIAWGAASFSQGRASKAFLELQADLGKAKAEALMAAKARDGWQAKAVASAGQAQVAVAQAAQAQAQAASALQRAKAAEAKLAALRPQPAATVAPKAPLAEPQLAEAFAATGFPPTLLAGPVPLGFTLDQAQPMLGLIQDGQAYPAALERIGLMDQDTAALHQEVDGLQTALTDQVQATGLEHEALTQSQSAEAAAVAQVADVQQEVADSKGQTSAVQTELKAQKFKTWLAGPAGVILGVLLHLL